MRPVDGLDADLSSYEAEMETEMLRNAADGLCIALLEPARALAHAADAGAPPVHARGVVDLAAVAFISLQAGFFPGVPDFDRRLQRELSRSRRRDV